jgi:hypothetical protein
MASALLRGSVCRRKAKLAAFPECKTGSQPDVQEYDIGLSSGGELAKDNDVPWVRDKV